MNKTDFNIEFYNFIYDFHVPALFILFITTFTLTGIFNSINIFYIMSSISIGFAVFSMFYLYSPFKGFKKSYKTLIGYKLNKDEKIIWKSICDKCNNGYKDWSNEYKEKQSKTSDELWYPPYTYELTKEENNLLHKIHDFYYPGWYTADPLGAKQVQYMMYEDIKNKL